MIPISAWQLFLTGSLYLPDPAGPDGRRRVVFQRVGRNFGNLPTRGSRGHQQRAHVIPYDPRTPFQQALRARLGAATTAWHALASDTKADYRTRAKALPYTGFNLWVKEWCRSHPLDPADYATADQAATTPGQLWLGGNPANLATPPTTPTRLNLALFA